MSVAVHHGNCLDLIPRLVADGLVADAVCTDPPYHLTPTVSRFGKDGSAPAQYGRDGAMARLSAGFMSAKWDGGTTAFEPETWATIGSALRPGGFLVAFGGCYDGQTEVLTRRGWVLFPEVRESDEFASLDIKTELVEFQAPREIVKVRHIGPMHRYRTNRIDLVVTPNHRMLVASLGQRSQPFSLVRSDQVGKSARMTKTSRGLVAGKHEPFILPGVRAGKGHGHYEIRPDLSLPAEVWAAFLGIWLAEGHASTSMGRRGGASTHVAITHYDQGNIEEMSEMLSPYFRVLLYPRSGRLRINDPRLFKHLAPLGKAHEKRLPSYVKTWSPPLLRTLLDWYARGDGDAEGRIYTSSRELADDIQEVAMYAGLAADISIRAPRTRPARILQRLIHAKHPQHVIRLLAAQTKPEVYARNRSTPTKSGISAAEWGGGLVYCVELPKHHTLYVRRNGKAVWCGNTRTYHRMACAIEDAGFIIQDSILDLIATDTRANQFLASLNAVQLDALSACLDQQQGIGALAWAFASGFPKRRDMLKPAYEPIVLAYKPGGKRTMQVDECRVGFDSEADKASAFPGGRTTSLGSGSLAGPGHAQEAERSGFRAERSGIGRWPANICHSGEDEVVAAFPESRAVNWADTDTAPSIGGVYGDDKRDRTGPHYADNGSAARFFFSAKAGAQDRWGSRHPTVKPVELMKWLISLVTPIGGTCLDPFAGSGTTGVAALATGRNAILIEREAQYHEDIKQRLAFYEGGGAHSVQAKNRNRKTDAGPLFSPQPQRMELREGSNTESSQRLYSETQDAVASYYSAIDKIGKDYKQGIPLPTGGYFGGDK